MANITLSNYRPAEILANNALTLPIQTVQPVAVSGSNGSYAYSTLSMGNSNGVSHYTTNGSVVASIGNVSVYAAGNTTGQSSSSNFPIASINYSAAGIISVGMSSNTLIISAPGTTGLTQLSAGFSNVGNTAGNTGLASAQLVLVGSNNITLSGSTNGGSQTISIFGNAGTGGGGGGGVNFGVSTGGNTAGATGTVSTGNVVLVGSGPISLSQATGAAGSAATITINAPATSSLSVTGILSLSVNGNTVSIGANALTAYAVSNTTQGTSGTVNGTALSFAGAGNVSVGVSNNSIVISGAGGGGGGGVNFGVSTGGNTAGATGTVSTGNVILVGSGPISLSQATGAAGSAATITINAPAISTLSATGIASISINGSTISIGAAIPLLSRTDFGLNGNSTSALTVGSASFKYVQLAQPITFSRVDVPILISLASIALANTADLNISSGLVIYSRNGSTLSPIYGTLANTTYTWASNTNNYSNLTGGKNVSFGINGSLSAGEYWIGFQLSTTNNSSIGTAVTVLGNTISMLGGVSYSASQIGDFGNTYSQSQNIIIQGMFSNTITATNQTIALSNLSATGAAAQNVLFPVVLRNY